MRKPRHGTAWKRRSAHRTCHLQQTPNRIEKEAEALPAPEATGHVYHMHSEELRRILTSTNQWLRKVKRHQEV